MTEGDVIEELDRLIREKIGQTSCMIGAQTTLSEDLEMDSLAQVSFLVEIEKSYAISVPDRVASGFICIGDIVDFVMRQLSSEGE